MTEPIGPRTPPASSSRPLYTRTYRRLVRGTNINEETLLATDYLNHFNEVAMLIEMIDQAPEFMDDVLAWRPMSYADHFRQGGFRHKALAVAAYDQAPPIYREPFDATIAELDRAVLDGVAAMAKASADGDPLASGFAAAQVARTARDLIDRASAIINGHSLAARQDEIDALIEGVATAADQQPREKYHTLGQPEAA
ncbi:MAG: hypothetical protein ACREER_09265 [Alphaproteobacteria bacterium]